MDFDELMKDLQNEEKEAEKGVKTADEIEALLVSTEPVNSPGPL